jgi:hypothetical protein
MPVVLPGRHFRTDGDSRPSFLIAHRVDTTTAEALLDDQSRNKAIFGNI